MDRPKYHYRKGNYAHQIFYGYVVVDKDEEQTATLLLT